MTQGEQVLRILLVDHQTLFRAGLKHLLSPLGKSLDVHEADCLDGALECLAPTQTGLSWIDSPATGSRSQRDSWWHELNTRLDMTAQTSLECDRSFLRRRYIDRNCPPRTGTSPRTGTLA
jgi:DNA-binding NarL/FixJ family response regulator